MERTGRCWIARGTKTGAVGTGNTNGSRGTDGFRPVLDGTEQARGGPFGGIRLRGFCFLETEPPVPDPDLGRFLEVEEDEGASSIGRSAAELVEELNMDGGSDPRSATSCGLVHFE